jgi:hypothetical protein
MQATASILTDQFSQLLARLPAGLDLDRLAAERGALARRREIKTGSALLRLALARGPGGLSLRETAAWAGLVGLAQLSNPAVKYRLDQAGGFLEAVVEHLLAAKAGIGAPCWRGRSLRLADGTSLSQPGSLGTDWRVHAVFDLGRGGFSDLQLTDARGAECLSRGQPVAGEVRIADRYFARAQALRAFRAASDNKADFIVRLRWNALRLRQTDGGRFDLIATLRALPPGELPQEVAVQVDPGRHAAPLPLRLVLLRKPPQAAEAARSALQRYASRKQKQLDPRTLVAAEFMMLATSLPAEDYPADQVLAAYRLRWQIELAFKRLKSLLHIDQLPTLTPDGSRSWLYAHLVMALLCDDLSQDFLESFP